MAVIRRRPPGKKGGRPVSRDFSFAPSDGQKYPSESALIRDERLRRSRLQLPSWSWALDKMQDEDCWLVVRIIGKDEDERKAEVNRVRAAIFRTAGRNSIHVTSEYVAPNIYFSIVKR